jgi:hypothetical protein
VSEGAGQTRLSRGSRIAPRSLPFQRRVAVRVLDIGMASYVIRGHQLENHDAGKISTTFVRPMKLVKSFTKGLLPQTRKLRFTEATRLF